MIWKHDISLEGVNRMSQNTMVEHLGIEFTGFGPDYLIARMPVDQRTVQPFRILHGGASATLAETVGSVAASLCIEDVARHHTVGIELNVSHLRSVRKGFVHATAQPVRIGRRIQVWKIDIRDDQGRMISTSRLTMAVVERN